MATTTQTVAPHLRDGDQDPFVQTNLRRNIFGLGLDNASFSVGLSFAPHTTLIPAFLSFLGATNLIIGVVPAIQSLGWFLPALLVSGYTESLPQRLPFLRVMNVVQRLPYLLLALIALTLAPTSPGLAIGLFLVVLVLGDFLGGTLMPAWMDVISRTIPLGIRGRFMAFSMALGSVGGLAAGGISAYVLSTVPPPGSYGLCLLIAAIVLLIGSGALFIVREPRLAGGGTPRTSLASYLGKVPALLGRERNLTWFLVARSLGMGGLMATGFYTVYAMATFHVEPWLVGAFTSIWLAGSIVGNVVIGWLADRSGNRLGVMIGMGGSILANAVALAAPSVEVFVVVLFLAGMQMASAFMASSNMLIEFAPRAEERPTYYAVGLSVTAPFALLAPIAGGLMADNIGYPVVFVTASVFGLASFLVLLLRVRDPRFVHRPDPAVV